MTHNKSSFGKRTRARVNRMRDNILAGGYIKGFGNYTSKHKRLVNLLSYTPHIRELLKHPEISGSSDRNIKWYFVCLDSNRKQILSERALLKAITK